jgi:hypothetical protein
MHLELLKKLLLHITDCRISSVVKLEQMIISGLEISKDKVVKVKNADLVKAISQISKELHERDYLRVLLIYFATFDLSPKDRETMMKSI